MIGEVTVQTRTEARRCAILEAATDLFLEKGYERTTLDDILERSKGSRSTVYKLFGNKEGLLKAIIEETTGEIWAIVSDWHAKNPPPTEQSLFELGCLLFTAIMAPRAIALHRILVSEGPYIPEVSAYFLKVGPDRNKTRLVEWFSEGQKSGHFMDHAPEDLAQIFMGLVISDLHLRRTFCQAPMPEEDAVRRRIKTAVQIFLNGVNKAAP